MFSTASRYSRCWKRTKEGGLYRPYQHLTPVISQPLEAHTHLNTMPIHTHNTRTLVTHYMKSTSLFLVYNIWTIYRMYLMHCKILWANFRNTYRFTINVFSCDLRIYHLKICFKMLNVEFRHYWLVPKPYYLLILKNSNKLIFTFLKYDRMRIRGSCMLYSKWWTIFWFVHHTKLLCG